MKISGKRAAELLLIALLLCSGAVYIGNMRTMQEPIPASATTNSTNSIENFRTERQQLRAMQKAQLNDIAHDTSADPETADMARRQLIEICAYEEMELTIEGILSMRGFKNPIATVHNDSVNVMIETQSINLQESSVILDLVSRETGALAGDIKIIPIN